MGDSAPLWLLINSPDSMETVSEWRKYIHIIRDFRELPKDCFRNLIPIGDRGAGWGVLCIDLSKNEDNIDKDNEDTRTLVWFDQEELDWNEQYLGEDGMLYGQAALPNLKILPEWYLYGVLEEEYEKEEGIKPTYKWYKNTLN